MSGAMHEDDGEAVVAGLAHHVTISAFILVGDQAITFSVHSEHGEVDVSVEMMFCSSSSRVRMAECARPCSGFPIVFQVEPRLFVESANFCAVDGMFELFSVVNAGIPLRIASGAKLQFRAKGKDKREVHLLRPQELVGGLGSKIVGGRLG